MKSKLNKIGFITRLCAYFIDVFLFLAASIVVRGGILYTVFWVAYQTWMIGTYGATVGKMVLKIKVVSEQGDKVDFQTAFLRSISSYLSALVFCLGYLWVIWDKDKQAWHDKIAKTLVVASNDSLT